MQTEISGENRHMSACFSCGRAKTSVRIKVPQLKFEGHLMNRNQVPQAVLTDITSFVLRIFGIILTHLLLCYWIDVLHKGTP